LCQDILDSRKEEDISGLETQILLFGDPDFDDRAEVMLSHPGEEKVSDVSDCED
jgi:hypothetical protein